MYSDHSVAAHQGKVGARILGRGALTALLNPCPVPNPSPPSFLPPGPPSPGSSQESKVNWDELSAAGGDIWPASLLVRRLGPTYIADISHVPLVLPEPPRHVDIGGRSGYRGVGTAVARQAVADHPCQDGAEGPGQAAHPCASLTVTSLTCELSSHPFPQALLESPHGSQVPHSHTGRRPHMTLAPLAGD